METLYDLQEELREVQAMSEDEVCRLYNVDTKEEAIQAIQEWMEGMEEEPEYEYEFEMPLRWHKYVI